MFEDLAKYDRIIVTGPQRSGTRICAKMIAHDTGHQYIDEANIGYHSYENAMTALANLERNSIKAVIQAPGLCHVAHFFPEDVLIVMMFRRVDDIEASQRRIGWRESGAEARERMKYGALFEQLYISEIKYARWHGHQKERIKRSYEVKYKDLAGHWLWINKERRAEFGPHQTELG